MVDPEFLLFLMKASTQPYFDTINLGHRKLFFKRFNEETSQEKAKCTSRASSDLRTVTTHDCGPGLSGQQKTGDPRKDAA